jgi:hypothetical protein
MSPDPNYTIPIAGFSANQKRPDNGFEISPMIQHF